MQDSAPAGAKEPEPAGPTRRPARTRRRWFWPLVVVAVVVVAVLGVYFAFFYTPGLPIPAGTVIQIANGDLENPVIGHYKVWAFTVTRCCAILTGSYHSDPGVGWGYGGPDFQALRQAGTFQCVNEPINPPEDGNFSDTFSSFSPLEPGPYILHFTVPCGLPSPLTIRITQTVQLEYL